MVYHRYPGDRGDPATDNCLRLKTVSGQGDTETVPTSCKTRGELREVCVFVCRLFVNCSHVVLEGQLFCAWHGHTLAREASFFASVLAAHLSR